MNSFPKDGTSPRIAVVVPQPVYQSRGAPIPLADPIKFIIDDNPGVLLSWAFEGQIEGLSAEPVMSGSSDRLSYRVEVRLHNRIYRCILSRNLAP